MEGKEVGTVRIHSFQNLGCEREEGRRAVAGEEQD